MPPKTLNQVLAENLRRLRDERGMSNNTLGAKAGVSPRTIANYLAPEEAGTQPTSGKERSAKLAEVQLIAAALGVHPVVLLTDSSERMDVARGLLDQVAADAKHIDGLSVAPRKRANGR